MGGDFHGVCFRVWWWSEGLVVCVPRGEELVTAAIAAGVVVEVVVFMVVYSFAFFLALVFGVLGQDFLDQACSLCVDRGAVGLVVLEREVFASIDEGHFTA